jgi:hypothetical protein
MLDIQNNCFELFKIVVVLIISSIFIPTSALFVYTNVTLYLVVYTNVGLIFLLRFSERLGDG